MRQSSAETLHEKIEAQHVIIERLREDNRTLTAAADTLLDQVEAQKEELSNLRKLVSEMLGVGQAEES